MSGSKLIHEFSDLRRSDILLVAAMRDELGELAGFQGPKFCFTGIGKVNSAYFLMRSLKQFQPKLVVNFGSVGSQRFATHSVVEAVRFHQRDMNVSPLGFAEGVTPFDSVPGDLEVPRRLQALGLDEAVCSTGDSFEVSGALRKGDIVDMEAFALAKVCKLEGLPFLCVKYVTDGADDQSHSTWEENLPKAADAFTGIFRQLFPNS